MNALSRILRNVRRWFRPGLFLNVERVAEVPDAPAADVVYLVGEDAPPWAAVLRCPCGCGVRTELLLTPGDDTWWRLTIDPGGTINLYPSVWRTKGCRSHYLIRESRIWWC